MNDADNTAAGRAAEAPPELGSGGAELPARDKPYLVRFETALRYARASSPELSEEDVVWALWDAAQNRKLYTIFQERTIKALHMSEPNEEGTITVLVEPWDDAKAIRAASFAKQDLERLFPPLPVKPAMPPPPAVTPDRSMAIEASREWLTFPLARARVMKALQDPADAAAEWLRLQTIANKDPIRAVFSRPVACPL